MLTRSDPNGVCVVLRVALEHRRVVEPAQLHPPGEDGKDCSGDFSEVRACEKTNCPRSREHKLKKALNLLR